MIETASPNCDVASMGQTLASPTNDMKIEAVKTIQEATVTPDPVDVQIQTNLDLQYAPDTSWAAYKIFIAIVFSEALLFGGCSMAALPS